MLGLHLSLWLRFYGGAAVDTFFRITEAGDRRITMAGDPRIIQP